MPFADHFHPEWGYLAPAPSFVRTVRIVIVAMAIGATAGAGAVLALIGKPASDGGTTVTASAAAVAHPSSVGTSISPAVAAVPTELNTATATPQPTADIWPAGAPAAAGSRLLGLSVEAPNQPGRTSADSGTQVAATTESAAAVPSVQPRPAEPAHEAVTAEKKPLKKHKKKIIARHKPPAEEANGGWNGREYASPEQRRPGPYDYPGRYSGGAPYYYR